MTVEEESIGPRLVARLYPDSRRANRVVAERPITLRAADNKPIEAMVENLSRTGFAMSTIADLEIGLIIGLSIGGSVRRRVRIVRRIGLAYGCEFLSPLSDLEVSAALRSRDVISADFLSDGMPSGRVSEAGRQGPRRLSYLARAYILGGLVASLWAIGIVVLWRVI
ncbi:MAG: PilZ domain-containing protein [Sphingomonas sp.]|nr:PilZ domain-containing protein [Sphingomonas sp.]